MTTAQQSFAVAHPVRGGGSSIDVFGIAWPTYKVHAVLGGLAAVALVLAVGGALTLAVWLSAAASITLWWGGRAASARRWDDCRRDHRDHAAF